MQNHSKEAVREYVKSVKKAHMKLGESLERTELDKLPSLSRDFEDTIKDAVNAVKQGLVEKNTEKYIRDVIKECGYKSEEVYLYAILPREAIEGNKEVQEMLEKVWNEILKNAPLKKGFGRVVHIDKDTLKELKEAIEAENMEKVESILRELKYGEHYEFGSGKEYLEYQIYTAIAWRE